MLIFPLVYTLYLSLHEWSLSSKAGPSFVGLRNYLKLLGSDRLFYESLWITGYYTAGSVAIELVLGLIVALFLNRRFRGRGILRSLFLFPMVATPVAISVVWAMLYEPNAGVLNQLLVALGLSPLQWIADASTVLPSLILVDVWHWTPLMTLILLAGLASLPPEPYESAIIDGATRRQVFWYVTLPLLRPTIVVAVLFRSIDALKTFETIYVLTEGGPGRASETLNLLSYHVGFVYYRMGYVSAMLTVFVLIILALSLLLIKGRRAR